MNPDQNPDPNQAQPTPSADPSAMYPQATATPPSSYPVQPAQVPTSPAKSSHAKLLLIIAVLVLLAGGAGAYFVKKNNDNKNKDIGGSVSVNSNKAATTQCAPILASSLDQASMITTYERFAKGVAAKNQQCANGLSSNNFLTTSKQTFAAPDGNWITAKVGSLPPISDEFAKLPSNFTDANFKTTTYTRATILGSSTPQTPASGTTLSYPEQGQDRIFVKLSFVLDNGHIKVDDVSVGSFQEI